jgi:hypothetical protein
MHPRAGKLLRIRNLRIIFSGLPQTAAQPACQAGWLIAFSA